MLNRFLLSNFRSTVPLTVSRRSRVRILPKERDVAYDIAGIKKKPGPTFATKLYSFVHRKNFTLKEFKHWRKWKEFRDMQEDQMYLPERHSILGANLATTHFICARGGKVKFVGSDEWTTQYDIEKQHIPGCYTPGYFIEEIDASGTKLCYEGFDNLYNLPKLKKLLLRNCPYVDDWCLSKCYLFAKSLQHLDISGCEHVTERGICTLHQLSTLKTLVLHDTPNLRNRELVTLMLQDIIPSVEIVGVDFKDPVLLKRLEIYMNE